ncbi:Fur-regulated basic protein FbpA [Robertmurraya yapensis]|uniref:Fur-regulated basic protein FbpA n=2 Tax=Bacillaceae TaxID=186817 RepID=A0A431VVG7_9BACI|nr:Fur-regulated basic protein FbpA [Bacillus yapensis]RTR27160.1 Fur-regulated basic protein FbpA [Bacillus yapensis]TKS94007.1 Fur-regulated basic protein FbpA [Bacillus yapensis]
MNDAMKRDELIDRLLQHGVFKIKNQQLFELSLQDLENELNKITQQNE